MKRIFTVLAIFVLPLLAIANNEKEFKKLIKSHDVPYESRELPDDTSLEDYWSVVLEKNVVFRNFVNDINKGKGAEKDALSSVNKLRAYDYKYNVQILEGLKDFCDTLIMEMGLPKEIFELNIIYDESPNAFTVLTKNGFAICLNSGLADILDGDYIKIMGVVAHEFTHGALMHHLRTEYEYEKNKRRDRIIGGISAGLTVASQAFEAYAAGVSGTEYDSSKYEKIYENIEQAVKESSLKFRYKYNRELEIEADLYAYRFLERMGMADKYIEVLRIIGQDDDLFWHDELDDHPSTLYRISFLEFVSNHPEYRLEVKDKNKKKKVDEKKKVQEKKKKEEKKKKVEEKEEEEEKYNDYQFDDLYD